MPPADARVQHESGTPWGTNVRFGDHEFQSDGENIPQLRIVASREPCARNRGSSLAAERGWRRVSVVQAARNADLKLDRARRRFPTGFSVLLRFGSLADQAALSLATDQGLHRDRLFDIVMRRIDLLQRHRAGVLALLRHLPADPPTALALFASRVAESRSFSSSCPASTAIDPPDNAAPPSELLLMTAAPTYCLVTELPQWPACTGRGMPHAILVGRNHPALL